MLLTMLPPLLLHCCAEQYIPLTCSCTCRKPSGVPCPDADFILVIARALPAFVLSLVDTGIFYTVRTESHPRPTNDLSWREPASPQQAFS